ncbi:hypothetical protein HYU06_03460 [Candidatus Woesearchaeota archaeon]|nr:hypothetical protein [Candidatus Woesearchaeota archaeon]
MHMSFQDENTLFRTLFGDTPKIRVLEYLLEGRELDHSIGDIAEGAGINRVTLFRMWNEMIKSQIIAHTRDIGNAKLYKINATNPYVKILIEVFDRIINVDFQEERIKKKVLV